MPTESAKQNAPVAPTVPTPPVPAMPAWTGMIDSASKLGALTLVAIYGIGYLVTSVHFAKMGMGFANPLKPRTAAAGVLFCVLFGIPLWLSEKVVQLNDFPILSIAEDTAAAKLYRLVHLFNVCVAVSVPISVLFAFTAPSSRWRVGVIIGLIFLESAYVVIVRSNSQLDGWTRLHPNLVGVLYFLLALSYIVIVVTDLVAGNFTWLEMQLWLFGCAVFITANRPPSTTVHAGTWPTLVGQVAISLSLFGTLVYPHIKSEWGGGQPIDVVVRFTRDSGLLASQTVKVQLLDDGDSGLYVLYKSPKHILFIPRADVAGLYFSGDPSDMP